MASRDEPVHVFVVRLRREPREIPDARPEWRGVIQHLGKTEDTMERRYLNNVSQIVPFIESFLEEPPSVPGVAARVKRWLTRRKS